MMTEPCPACEGKRGRYSTGRRVAKWFPCPACKGWGKLLTAVGIIAALKSVRCPNCNKALSQVELTLRAYKGDAYGFDFVASCPDCKERRRLEEIENAIPF